MRVDLSRTRAAARAAAGCLLAAGLAAGQAGGLPGTPARAGAAGQPWARVPTPGVASQLLSVGCAAAGPCWAVGSYQAGHVSHNQVLRWNGRRWRPARVPGPGFSSHLSAVSCPAARSCLAVGGGRRARNQRAHAEVLRWDGRRWAVTRAPAGLPGLTALSCPSARDCWALNADGDPVTAVHWNGRGWGAPFRLGHGAGPRAISCLSATDCWVAGDGFSPDGAGFYNLVLHWNGTAWTRARVPQPTHENQLTSIACASRGDCWAAGLQDAPNGYSKNQLLHWNGRHWSVSATPDNPQVGDELLGITCRLRTDCWAVGDNEDGPEALHWGGHRWLLTRIPHLAGVGSLDSVACRARADCLAAGTTGIPPRQNYARHWNGARWAAA